MNPLISAAPCLRALACCVLSAAPLLAQAQATDLAQTARRPDPLDAQAPVPPLQYQSTLQGYRPLAEQDVADWKQLNDNTGRIGGWRVYAKQARQPEPAPGQPAQAAAPEKAGTPEHAGHKGHGQ